jgi:hypothetical protein
MGVFLSSHCSICINFAILASIYPLDIFLSLKKKFYISASPFALHIFSPKLHLPLGSVAGGGHIL